MVAQLLMLLLFFQPSPTVRGQYIADYKKIVDVYKNAPSLTYTVKYKSYDSNAERPDTILQGRYMCKGKNMYSKIGTTESYLNNKYLVALDNMHKIMFLKSSKGINTENTPYKLIDSVVLRYKCDITVMDDRETRKYTIEYPYPGIDNLKGKMTMEFNKTTNLISKVIVYLIPSEDPYKKEKTKKSFRPFWEFDYMDYNLNVVPDEIFSTDKFFSLNGKEAVLKDPYKKYQLINSLFFNPANR